jgi:hypothetical protein
VGRKKIWSSISDHSDQAMETTMRRSILTAALFALMPLATLESQRPITVGVAGGLSLPVGDFGDAVDPGWHALGTLTLGTAMQPLGLRLDAAYNQFARSATTPSVLSGSQTAASVTLNPTYRLPMTNSPLSPYVIAGAGAYRLACTGDAECSATTRFGWNGGVGTKFSSFGLRGFLEARYNRIAFRGGNVSYVPFTIGLTF